MSVYYTMYIYCKCVQKSMYIMYVAYMCIFIYKHTVSPLSTRKCYNDIPKLPLKMQWNNAINMRNSK